MTLIGAGAAIGDPLEVDRRDQLLVNGRCDLRCQRQRLDLGLDGGEKEGQCSGLLLSGALSSLWSRVATDDHRQIPGTQFRHDRIRGDRAAAFLCAQVEHGKMPELPGCITRKLGSRPSSKAPIGLFPEIPLQFPPYLHQERAFRRMAGDSPQSAIVSTGTGSGKTESFLLPILDYCRRHRGEPDVKAIIICPMSALSSDQATLLARLIHGNDFMRGHVNVGLFVGQSEGEPSVAMESDNVITHKDSASITAGHPAHERQDAGIPPGPAEGPRPLAQQRG